MGKREIVFVVVVLVIGDGYADVEDFLLLGKNEWPIASDNNLELEMNGRREEDGTTVVERKLVAAMYVRDSVYRLN